MISRLECISPGRIFGLGMPSPRLPSNSSRMLQFRFYREQDEAGMGSSPPTSVGTPPSSLSATKPHGQAEPDKQAVVGATARSLREAEAPG